MTRLFDGKVWVEVQMQDWTEESGYGPDWSATFLDVDDLERREEAYLIDDAWRLCARITEFATRTGEYIDVPVDSNDDERVYVSVGYSLDRMYIIRNSETMAPDQNGRHATGREVVGCFAGGPLSWLADYEGDETEGLPLTDYVNWDAED